MCCGWRQGLRCLSPLVGFFGQRPRRPRYKLYSSTTVMPAINFCKAAVVLSYSPLPESTLSHSRIKLGNADLLEPEADEGLAHLAIGL